MTVDYTDLNPKIVSDLSEWTDWESDSDIPLHDLEILLGWARYLAWRVENHKELIKTWFLEGDDKMANIASDPEKVILSFALGLLLAAYGLGEGKPIKLKGVSSFEDHINTMDMD